MHQRRTWGDSSLSRPESAAGGRRAEAGRDAPHGREERHGNRPFGLDPVARKIDLIGPRPGVGRAPRFRFELRQAADEVECGLPWSGQFGAHRRLNQRSDFGRTGLFSRARGHPDDRRAGRFRSQFLIEEIVFLQREFKFLAGPSEQFRELLERKQAPVLPDDGDVDAPQSIDA